MATVRAAILAAGRGVRMGGAEPKTLIPLGGREPMLFHILSGLKSAGIDDILVVTGFKPQAIQDYIATHFAELEPTYVFNARFASWGNFHSVRVALDQSPGMDVLVVNSDVVVHPEVYRRVVETWGDLVLAVQKRRVLDDEDMRVRIEGNTVLGIGKDLKRAFSHGEYAGVSLLRPLAARAYGDVANGLEWTADTDLYYEDVYSQILEKVEARSARVDDHEYAEVDTPEDVAAAVAVVERHPEAWATASSA